MHTKSVCRVCWFIDNNLVTTQHVCLTKKWKEGRCHIELKIFAHLDRKIAIHETWVSSVMIMKKNGSDLKLSTFEKVCVDKSRMKTKVVGILSVFGSYTRTNGHRRSLPRCPTKTIARRPSSSCILRSFRLQRVLGRAVSLFYSVGLAAETTIQYLSAETFGHWFTLWKLRTDTKMCVKTRGQTCKKWSITKFGFVALHRLPLLTRPVFFSAHSLNVLIFFYSIILAKTCVTTCVQDEWWEAGR